MKKETIIRKIDKRIKELFKEKESYTSKGSARKHVSIIIIELRKIKMDLEKLE